MRRLLLGAGLTVLALVAPAWGATSDVDVANFAFTPSSVSIQPGDTVTWHFRGPDLNHSVTSDPGQSESFDSDPGDSSPLHSPADTFSHTFNAAGTFTYVCKVHSFMSGEVVVGGPAGGAPSTGGGTPTSGDSSPPAISLLRATGGRSCSGAKRACRRKPTRISFTLSERARVRLTFRRRGGHSPRPRTVDGDAGANTIKLSPRRVPRGRYRLRAVATDAAGNRSSTATTRFRVR